MFRNIYIFLVLCMLSCVEKSVFWQPDMNFVDITKIDNVQTFNLDSLPKNVSYLVIHFFAPKCTTCIQELPILKKYYMQYISHNHSIRFMAVGSMLDILVAGPVSETKIYASVKRFARKYRLPYPVYAANKKIISSFRVNGFPETIFMRKNIHDKWILDRKILASITLDDLKRYLPL